NSENRGCHATNSYSSNEGTAIHFRHGSCSLSVCFICKPAVKRAPARSLDTHCQLSSVHIVCTRYNKSQSYVICYDLKCPAWAAWLGRRRAIGFGPTNDR